MVRRKTHTNNFIHENEETCKPLKNMITTPEHVLYDYSWVDKRIFRFWDVKNAVVGLIGCFPDDMEFTGSEIKNFIITFFEDVN